MRRLRRAVAALRARARFERDLHDELGDHLRRRAADLERTGLSPADAARQARLEFGAIEAWKERCRDAGGLSLIRPFLGLRSDLVLAARRLLATPLFLAFAVISLALGVSVTTTVYSALYAFLWKPVGVREPSRVAMLTAVNGMSASWRNAVSRRDLDDLRARQRSFAALAAHRTVMHSLEMPAVSEMIILDAVSAGYFDVVGVEPTIGRMLQPDDHARGAAVLVLTHSIWRSRFAADPGVIGRVVRIGVESFEVVGVGPRSFHGFQTIAAVTPGGWVPIEVAARLSAPPARPGDDRDRRELTVVGRLAAGATLTAAAAELAAISAGLDAAVPARTFRAVDGSAVIVRRQWSAEDVTRAVRPWAGLRIDLVLLGVAMLVLLVACTNLANLMLSRGATRLHEFAVRRALGASRWRLVREQLAESLLIAVLGGAATWALTRVLLTMATIEIPTAHRTFRLEPELNVPALLFASAALLLSVFVFGLEPAMNLTRRTLKLELADDPSAAPRARTRRQRRLIRWQVALSTCFFVVTAVLVKVIVAETRNDSGIALERLAVTTLHFGVQGWDETRARRAIGRALETARSTPGIASASVTTGLPFGFQMTLSSEITTPDRPFVKGVRPDTTLLLAGSPDLLQTLDVPLVRGRRFTDRDDAAAPRVAIVSESTERALFGGPGLDRQIVLRDREHKVAETVTVVGVAKDTDVDRLMSRRGNLVYLPFAQRYRANLALVARTSRDPADAVRVLRNAVRQADPDLAVGVSGPASWLTTGPYVAARIAGMIAAALGALTLILAMVGLYGVQAQAVAQRTREVGVRMALGAAASQIERMVLREGFRPVVEGLAIGLLIGIVARAGLRALVVASIPIVDVFTLATVPIPLGLAAFLACYFPARRASRVDPNMALHHL